MAKRSRHPGVVVVERPEGLFARWEDGQTGRRVERSLTAMNFASKTAALPYLIELSDRLRREKARRKRGQFGAGQLVPLSGDGGVLEAYEADFRAQRGDQAWKNQASNLAVFTAWLANERARDLRGLSRHSLSQFHSSLVARTASGDRQIAASTVNRRLNAVKAFLNWCRRQGFASLASDDIKDALRALPVARKLPRTLSPAEVQRLVREAARLDEIRFRSRRDGSIEEIPDGPQRYAMVAPFVLLALLTGMRQGELWALRWEDVDIEAAEIRVMRSKTDVQRAVPLHDSPALLKLLAALRGADEEFVLGGLRGRLQRRVWQRLMEAAEISGAQINDLRKTCISAVVSGSTYAEYLLEARFGHSKDVSALYYRRAQHTARHRGVTVEAWLGGEAAILEGIKAIQSELMLRDGFA